MTRERTNEAANALPPDESPRRDEVCDALTDALLFAGMLARAAGERTTLDLCDEGHIRGLARLLTTRDAKGRDGPLGENTRALWNRVARALASPLSGSDHG